MDNNKKMPILSISIPTWNRAKYLAISLERFLEEINGINPEEIELCVSDNCSDDNTSEVVNKYIEKGLPISYYKNDENIGASRNFLRCMERASGKYILLLGDDDILNPGALKVVLERLSNNDYGLIHIHRFENLNESFIEFNDLEPFYQQISYWITFMSGSIFRKDVVEQIDFKKYIGTHLLQMPYYIVSATKGEKNLLVNMNLLKVGLDSSSNGGYNFYEVFVKNYLNIWKEFVDNGTISTKCYKFVKKDIYVRYIDYDNNYRLLVKHECVKDTDSVNDFSRKGFLIDGAMDILKKYYGGEPYFYWSMIRMYLRKYLAPYYHMLKNNNSFFVA